MESVTAKDLQKWIDHLSEDEMDLPIYFSETLTPNFEKEMFCGRFIGHYLSREFDCFILVLDEIKGCDTSD